ncbi:MAG: SPOR domain-containing protein [Ferruginibacter sp.]
MKNIKSILLIFTLFAVTNSKAQGINDSTGFGTAVVIKDERIDLLGKKMAEYNTSLGIVAYANGLTSAKGYRLMVISTNDRPLAMKIRSQLYQMFPDPVQHKLYMSYQLPNIKVKFGNFLDKAEADKARKQILNAKIVTTNIYILPETIEVKPVKEEKEKEKD